MVKKPDEIDVWVGARARLRRREMGLSQTEVGKHLGVTFQQIQNYEKGTTQIGVGRLAALAVVLAVPISYFFPDAASAFTGSTATTPEVSDLLGISGALQILRDYARIGNPATRRAARSLLASLADDRANAGETDST